MTRVTFRAATPADFLALQGEPPVYRCRSFAAVLGDQLLGVGALVYPPGGDVWASCLISEQGRRYPAAVHRAGLHLMAMVRDLGLQRVLAAAEHDNARAEPWLERLGFRREFVRGHAVFVWNRRS